MTNSTVSANSSSNSTSSGTSSGSGIARSLRDVIRPGATHFVGDGFRVHGLLTPDRGISPFLLMDYHPPFHYDATPTPRGVGVHPHRGFETVTLAFQGAVAHHDSTGGGGVIRPGDVQWMTAARGILHKEYHEAEWASHGGTMQMLQLWVNLPAADKLSDPGYQPITAAEIPSVAFADGSVRVIAGEFESVKGAARTFTPIEMWDVEIRPNGTFTAPVAPGHNALALVLDGALVIAGQPVEETQLAVFELGGDVIEVAASNAGARVIVLAGEPIDEPVATYGPFVMNTKAELVTAIDDFNRGEFGHLAD